MSPLVRIAAVVAALALLVPAASNAAPSSTLLLSVDDGSYLYDTDNDCAGDTDTHTNAVALRHWHVGVPFAGAESEPAGGFGCLGGPKSWTVTVSGTAEVSGSIKYAWDQNVPGGGLNDVHLSIRSAGGDLIHTAIEDGAAPVVPGSGFLVRSIRLTLPAGTWTITEDVFSGEHTAWVTRLTVLE